MRSNENMMKRLATIILSNGEEESRNDQEDDNESLLLSSSTNNEEDENQNDFDNNNNINEHREEENGVSSSSSSSSSTNNSRCDHPNSWMSCRGCHDHRSLLLGERYLQQQQMNPVLPLLSFHSKEESCTDQTAKGCDTNDRGGIMIDFSVLQQQQQQQQQQGDIDCQHPGRFMTNFSTFSVASSSSASSVAKNKSTKSTVLQIDDNRHDKDGSDKKDDKVGTNNERAGTVMQDKGSKEPRKASSAESSTHGCCWSTDEMDGSQLTFFAAVENQNRHIDRASIRSDFSSPTSGSTTAISNATVDRSPWLIGHDGGSASPTNLELCFVQRNDEEDDKWSDSPITRPSQTAAAVIRTLKEDVAFLENQVVSWTMEYDRLQKDRQQEVTVLENELVRLNQENEALCSLLPLVD